jgi:branched-chain amino acid transport system substrate-binding protein
VLKPAGLEASKGLITALYLEDITDPAVKKTKAYEEWANWMKKYYPEGALDDGSNAYAYVAAKTLVHTLKQCGNDFSRENIMKQAANIKNLELPLLVSGIKLNTSPTDYAPIEQEELAKFDGERWVLFGELLDAYKK